MTPSQADQRIMLSRRTLHRYRAMIDAGTIPSEDIALIGAEIDRLVDIARLVPDKAAKIATLIGQWRDLLVAIRGKLN
ncbi:hypothetical protein A3840_00055 [Devosia elaeis]|uniref:Uncharacterized protein n=1 Tax=Devosia elaeis TaxID=1770058 RepID=A0A178I553_9HYPH|nr:hypothetical protein A3840_00055 [Devosia elaeis]